MQKTVMLLLHLCLMMLLSSCSNTPAITQTETVKLSIPPELLTCDPFPIPKPVKMQSEFAAYTLRGWQAWADCSGKLAAIREKVKP